MASQLNSITQYLVRLWLRVLRKSQILSHINFTLFSLNDRKISIPLIYSIGYDHFFEKEKWLTDLLKKLIPAYCQSACFFDVGANIGQTLLKIKSINNMTWYVGFEPNPNCLFYLYQLIDCNKFDNVVVFPYALANVNGIIDLNFHSDQLGDSTASIVPNFRSKKFKQIKAPVIDGNELESLKVYKAGIVKIDVEGGELEVVKGLLTIIQLDRPIIICEILPIYSCDNKFRLQRQTELESILSTVNYILAVINVDFIREIDSIGIHSDIEQVNYLLYPVEEKKRVSELMNGL